jgi:hypothetical protein
MDVEILKCLSNIFLERENTIIFYREILSIIYVVENENFESLFRRTHGYSPLVLFFCGEEELVCKYFIFVIF